MLRFSCYSCNWTTWSSFYRVLKSKHIYSRTSLYRASLYREPRYTVHHSFPPKISVNFLILGKIPCFHRIILFIFAIHHGAAGPGPVARYHATVTWQCCSIQWLPQQQSSSVQWLPSLVLLAVPICFLACWVVQEGRNTFLTANIIHVHTLYIQQVTRDAPSVCSWSGCTPCIRLFTPDVLPSPDYAGRGVVNNEDQDDSCNHGPGFSPK